MDFHVVFYTYIFLGVFPVADCIVVHLASFDCDHLQHKKKPYNVYCTAENTE